MTAAHKGSPPPEYHLTLEQAHWIDTLRLAEKYGRSPQEIEAWPMEWVNRAIELYKADNKIAEMRAKRK